VGEKWVSDDCSYLCKGLISEKLKEYWSPEQIMGRLELDKKIKISTETIIPIYAKVSM
jgi:IS30 family transposase